MSQELGSSPNAVHGEQLLEACAACHGASAEGIDGNGSPRLAGQHYVYLVSQLDDAKAGRRPDFPPEHVHLDESIGRADLMSVADYLSRLGH